jgi:hypothetical protein
MLLICPQNRDPFELIIVATQKGRPLVENGPIFLSILPAERARFFSRLPIFPSS